MISSILHIGYHKTATTWFQKNFYPYVSNYSYINRITARNAFLFDHSFQFDATQANNALQKSTQLPLILCDEDFSGNFHSAGLYGGWTVEIAKRLASTFPHSRIVIFIREQKSILASIYQQYIREGGTHKPQRYFYPYSYLPRSGFQPAKIALFSLDHFKYPQLIKLYQKHFGNQNVHVFLYEDFVTNRINFIKNFSKKLNLDITDTDIKWNSQNTGYQHNTLKIARALNYYTWRDVVDKKYFCHIPGLYYYSRKWLRSLNKRIPMGGKVTPKNIFNQELINAIDQFYKQDNQWLVENFNLPLQKYDYCI